MTSTTLPPGPLQAKLAADHFKPMMPRLVALIERGISQSEVAAMLSREGFKMRSGKPIHQVCVQRLWKKYSQSKGARDSVIVVDRPLTRIDAILEKHEEKKTLLRDFLAQAKAREDEILEAVMNLGR